MANSHSFKPKATDPRMQPTRPMRTSTDTPPDPDPIPGMNDFGYMKMQGVLNARDLGGMPAAHGRRIKRRRLLRSGDLHNATAIDVAQLTDMHDMECILDLRTDIEVEADPDALPLMQGVEYIHLEVLPRTSILTFSRIPLGKETQLAMEYFAHPYEVMQGLYQKCLLGELGMHAYSSLLETLLKSEGGATLWHCTQGKDRTGIAAILVEYCLGVPEQYIHDDYLATNLFVKGWMEKMTKLLSNKRIAKGLDSDIRAYAFASDRYFDTLCNVVKGTFGSLDNYLTRALDFGPDKRERLRELYLE